MSHRSRLLALLSILAFAGCGLADQPNVLFIAVDDLRPELSCYGVDGIVSPNLDRLANQSLRFERAYCMVPTCGASRASLFTGLRPTSKRFLSFKTIAEKDAPGITTLNTHFKTHGYQTISLGKVFHDPKDNSNGWTNKPWRPRGIPKYHRPENLRLHNERATLGQKPHRGPAWESAAVEDEAYADGAIATKAIEELRRLEKGETPFFLAVGFLKPHLPFVAPKKYWDMYDANSLRGPTHYFVPKNAPEESIHTSGEMRAYSGIPRQGPVSDETARKLIHGYYACVSFVDAQIGRVLDELASLGLNEDTIVIVWSDHGWNLGEHTLWCKHSCYETSMRVPLFIRVPGLKGGRSTNGLTELIDLYPTLCELTALPVPEHLHGHSLVPLLRDPDLPWKSEAHGRFQNGDTVRTDRFRFTRYQDRKGNLTATMLYDHTMDPAENENTVAQPEYEESVKRLSGSVATMTQELSKAKGQ
ncbi:MAG: sulfatase [Planctomycetota bacterium]